MICTMPKCARRPSAPINPLLTNRGRRTDGRASRTLDLSGGLITALAAFILATCCGCGRPDGAVKYGTVPVSVGNIVEHVTASGSLSAVVSVDVGSQVSGKISALYADFNSPVRKGQLVAEVDPTVYAAALRQSVGDLASAKADVTLKRENLERTKVLAPQRAASQLDLDQAVAQLAQAEATVTIKQAAVESAQANLGYCKITAPVDGIVISRKVDVGQTVIAAMSTPVLFTIAQDITEMNISADVSEADIGQVRAGQVVEFTVDAYPDEVFHGRVTQVRKSPTTTQNVVTYQTIISVKNRAEKLFPGMTADVSILVARRANAVEIPNAALRFVPPQGASFEQSPPTGLQHNEQVVYLLASGGKKLRPVVIKTGISDGVDTEVLEGVTAGAALVTSSASLGASSGGFASPPPQVP
jgi:HlyD family secretion protein